MTNKIYFSKFISLLLIMMFVLVACGGNASDAPTKEPATAFPTYAFVETTKPAVFNQTAESTEETTETINEAIELDPKLVGRGLGSYEKLECGTCHGTNGEGTDDGGAINELSLAQEEFVTFMRSGGDIGSSHQYSTDRLSKNGTTNLYQYILSLAQDK